MLPAMLTSAIVAVFASSVRADDGEMITDCATYNATCLQLDPDATPSCTEPKLGFPSGSAYSLIGVCANNGGLLTVNGYKGPDMAVAEVNGTIESMCNELFVPACQSYPCVSGANVEPSYVCSSKARFTKSYGLCLCPSGLVSIPPFVNPTSTPSIPPSSGNIDSSATNLASGGLAKTVGAALVGLSAVTVFFL
ncbi:hypothetical protein CXG81DRAFT_25138 [Caulochytrium protostelioides]|uniref:Uncharacterized protein n=1 Tax=Caulochytrium protostelioides TaxID=1555241 RepID=A0A4P9XAN8_9FUNG|nr:hypothetical protein CAUPRSCDRAFT_10899 [Caulochytrium protostelioides]RKP02200.1 hypothetical protein CXG81DRAFT_25138 [Caulochytrium protostelioides]|eukprot:RKP02200.1 hypothetical protein CXG81DRAFT_25138 [Caulochytrium protostelioides]